MSKERARQLKEDWALEGGKFHREADDPIFALIEETVKKYVKNKKVVAVFKAMDAQTLYHLVMSVQSGGDFPHCDDEDVALIRLAIENTLLREDLL